MKETHVPCDFPLPRLISFGYKRCPNSSARSCCSSSTQPSALWSENCTAQRSVKSLKQGRPSRSMVGPQMKRFILRLTMPFVRVKGYPMTCLPAIFYQTSRPSLEESIGNTVGFGYSVVPGSYPESSDSSNKCVKCKQLEILRCAPLTLQHQRAPV